MYCKNCGRQLKEGTRFCDRCGQSVRKSQQSGQAARHREIEELKAERLNRKKRLAEKEAKQARNKKRKKKKGNVLIFLFVILLIAVVSVIIGYNIFPDNGSISRNNGDAAPESTAMSSAATPSQQPSSAKNGYSVLTIGNINCPYPSDFHANAVSGNEKLSLVDSLGGATMVVRQEGKSGAPKDLMLEFANQGGTASYSRAGDDWYAITIENNGTVTHRKCIVRNGIAVYYDFSYNSSSASKKKYEEYTSYIDSNFK